MLTDDMLVYRTKNGDPGAYEVLVQRYQHKVYNLASKMVSNREDARDLVQETFLQVYRSLGHFKGESSFGTWVYRIASNKCLDFLRKRKCEEERVTLSTFENELSPGDSRGSPEESAIKEEERRRVRDALDGLPHAYRIVLILQHYQQLSYKEIAGILDIPEKTVATRLYRAKVTLRKRLTGGDTVAVQRSKDKSSQLYGRGVSII